MMSICLSSTFGLPWLTFAFWNLLQSGHTVCSGFLHIYYLLFVFLENVDEHSLQYFMSALQNASEVDNENNELKVPRTKEERIQLGM